jgi:hypothetical protein
MFEAVGYRVKDLVRIRIGNLRLGDLPRGHWRALTNPELKSLRHSSDVVAADVDRGHQKASHRISRRSRSPRLPHK